jgi:hypothetical protein
MTVSLSGTGYQKGYQGRLQGAYKYNFKITIPTKPLTFTTLGREGEEE